VDAADIFLCRYGMRAFFGRFCYSFQNVSPDTCNPLYIIINHKVPKTKVMKVDSILFVLHGVVCGGHKNSEYDHSNVLHTCMIRFVKQPHLTQLYTVNQCHSS
jgi:hypothetical protein